MRCPVEAPILPSSYANEECEGKRISERRLAGELARQRCLASASPARGVVKRKLI